MNYDDLFAKAMANFLHREIIEDAHSKYNISQEDMEQMNRKAKTKLEENRKKVYLYNITWQLY